MAHTGETRFRRRLGSMSMGLFFFSLPHADNRPLLTIQAQEMENQYWSFSFILTSIAFLRWSAYSLRTYGKFYLTQKNLGGRAKLWKAWSYSSISKRGVGINCHLSIKSNLFLIPKIKSDSYDSAFKVQSIRHSEVEEAIDRQYLLQQSNNGH